MKKLLVISSFAAFLLPFVAFADPVSDATAAFNTAIRPVLDTIINPLILLLFAVALVYFLWGVVTYIRNLDAPAEKTKGQSHMLWGVVGMAIMLGVFGIMNFIYNSVVTDTGGSSITINGNSYQQNPPAALNKL